MMLETTFEPWVPLDKQVQRSGLAETVKPERLSERDMRKYNAVRGHTPFMSETKIIIAIPVLISLVYATLHDALDFKTLLVGWLLLLLIIMFPVIAPAQRPGEKLHKIRLQGQVVYAHTWSNRRKLWAYYFWGGDPDGVWRTYFKLKIGGVTLTIVPETAHCHGIPRMTDPVIAQLAEFGKGDQVMIDIVAGDNIVLSARNLSKENAIRDFQ